MSLKIGSTDFTEFDDLYNDPTITPSAERAKIDFEVSLIGKLIEARESKGLSQKQLAQLAGLKQPAIARLENMKATSVRRVKQSVSRVASCNLSI